MKYVMISLAVVQCLTALTEAGLYERSEFWPPFCHANKMITVDDQEIPNTTRGILLRVVDDAGARSLVDFGRKGVHLVPTSSTDIMERANRIEAGSEPKRYPNLVELLGTRIIQVQASEAKRFPPEDYAQIKRFVCIRFSNTNDEWANVAAWIHGQADVLAAPESVLILFPEGGVLDDEIIFEHISRNGITDVCYLYSFLAESYQRLLWHGLEEGAAAAWRLELGAEGRIIVHEPLNLPRA